MVRIIEKASYHVVNYNNLGTCLFLSFGLTIWSLSTRGYFNADLLYMMSLKLQKLHLLFAHIGCAQLGLLRH